MCEWIGRLGVVRYGRKCTIGGMGSFRTSSRSYRSDDLGNGRLGRKRLSKINGWILQDGRVGQAWWRVLKWTERLICSWLSGDGLLTHSGCLNNGHGLLSCKWEGIGRRPYGWIGRIVSKSK